MRRRTGPSHRAGATDRATLERLLAAGRFEDAATGCRTALRRAPRDADLHELNGRLELRQAHYPEAARCFEKGLRVAPGHEGLLLGHAAVCRELGRYDDSLASADRVLSAHPEHAGALALRADALQRLHRGDDALAALAPLVATGGEDAEGAMVYAELLRQAGDRAEAAALLEKHLAAPQATGEQRWHMQFRLGRIYEQLEDYDRSFAAFRAAHALIRRPFDIESVERKYDGIRAAFAPERVAALPRSTNDSELPVFIVGVPRSGTTLLEQIIDAHPQAHGAGEIYDLFDRVHELARELRTEAPFPESLATLDRRTADRLSHRHVGRLKQIGGDALRVTDKNLQTVHLVGLMALLFPRGRVIWCRRDPMDTCLSCYMHPLSTAAAPWAKDLAHLGAYHLAHDRLMRYWVDLDLIPILEVRYENVIEDPEGQSRRMIDFLGLEWDDACLRFHESRRSVATLSYDQVRRPIYRTAIRRHEKFAAHLGPLRQALEENVDSGG